MVKSSIFGYTAQGEEVRAYTIDNGKGVEMTVLDYGATIQSLKVPGRNGRAVDVVLGYDSASGYEQGDGYLGATIGRVGNRIGGGKFSLNGREYSLYINDGANHLHGGEKGFDKRMWSCEAEAASLSFSYLSPDGEEGYPGNLQVKVIFTLTEDNSLSIRYEARTDADCPVSLTNHSYFNLAGEGDILAHLLKINADFYLENDSGCLPTGKPLPVDGAFDFRQAKPVGRDIATDHEQLRMFGGYDHNFVLSSGEAARLTSPESGISMTVTTDLPGMQLYTANSLSARKGKDGRDMGLHSALCLETQMFPNAINCPEFASPVLKAGEKLISETVFKFEKV